MEKIETTYDVNPLGQSKRMSEVKTKYFSGALDIIVKILVCLFLFTVGMSVLQDMWTQEMQRQQYCATGGGPANTKICQ